MEHGSNKYWRIERRIQHWAHTTPKEDKRGKNTTQKTETKRVSCTDSTTIGSEAVKGKLCNFPLVSSYCCEWCNCFTVTITFHHNVIFCG